MARRKVYHEKKEEDTTTCIEMVEVARIWHIYFRNVQKLLLIRVWFFVTVIQYKCDRYRGVHFGHVLQKRI